MVSRIEFKLLCDDLTNLYMLTGPFEMFFGEGSDHICRLENCLAVSFQ